MVQIELESPDHTVRRNEPVTCGIPWPRGALREVSQLRLFDGKGQLVGLQSRAVDLWPDDSVRWALLDWQAVVETKTTYRVEIGPADPPVVDSRRIQLRQDGQCLTIETGAACFVLKSGGRFPFESITVGGQPAIDAERTQLTVESDANLIIRPRIEQIEIIEAGPLRAVVRLSGSLGRAGGKPWCLLSAYLHFFAGHGAVRIDLTLHNPRAAAHPGNFWSLGDKGSIFIRDAGLTLAFPQETAPAHIHFSTELLTPFKTCESPLELYQDSSGGENWRGTVHVNRHLDVPNTFRGYRLRVPDGEEAGLRATPCIILDRGARCLGLAMEYFWQNFPKAIEASRDTLTLRLFPKQYADMHELQGGEQKTHTFWISFVPDGVTDAPLTWCRAPLRAHATPSWYCSTGAVPRLTPKLEDPHTLYLQLVDAAIEGNDTFEHKRETIDEYGWRNFGEIYADHEAVFHKGPNRLVSHYNNQYDPIAGCGLQFLRSGDWRWWLLMHELALHVRDIDIYHTEKDKAAYNHGLFWHTCHYVDAGPSTHRTYPPHTETVTGGGPGGSQNYATGLMLHYFLTGEPLSRQTAIDLAQWTIDMDDGRKSTFRWLAGGYTGLASGSALFYYHGPGRAPANSLNSLLVGHRLTGERAFLNKADQIICRCIHPADNIESHNLLDAELKWFYTMFLQSLGRYLDLKAECGQVDRMYAYARESLQHYARWMADHERPYLDHPEILEYPTETWAAQDMRKSEVFEAAARVAATPEEREKFLERSRFFFKSATTTLAEWPTRSLARPVVLLLSYGLARAYSQLNPDFPSLPVPEGTYDFGSPEVFIPQKTVAIRRFKLFVALAGVVTLGAIIVAISVLMWRA
jgi:hypothetical protein